MPESTVVRPFSTVLLALWLVRCGPSSPEDVSSENAALLGPLDMGFGEQRYSGAGDKDWLRLEDPTKFDRNGGARDRVAEYLDYAHADWVASIVEWKNLDGTGAAAARATIRQWVVHASAKRLAPPGSAPDSRALSAASTALELAELQRTVR